MQRERMAKLIHEVNFIGLGYLLALWCLGGATVKELSSISPVGNGDEHAIGKALRQLESINYVMQVQHGRGLKWFITPQGQSFLPSEMLALSDIDKSLLSVEKMHELKPHATPYLTPQGQSFLPSEMLALSDIDKSLLSVEKMHELKPHATPYLLTASNSISNGEKQAVSKNASGLSSCKEEPIDPELVLAFRSAGIASHVHSKLAALSWVTVDYVQAIAADTRKRKGGTPGLTVRRIEANDPMPQAKGQGDLEANVAAAWQKILRAPDRAVKVKHQKKA